MATTGVPGPPGPHRPPGPPSSYDMNFWRDQLLSWSQQKSQNWILLRKILDRDYGRIYHIWRHEMKSASQRRRVIELAKGPHGGIADNRRPDLNGWEERGINHGITSSSYKLPFLTKEDLAHGDNILMLAYHRANRHWTEYNHTDLYSTRPAREEPRFHGFYVNNLKTTPPNEAQGKLVSFTRRSVEAVQSNRPGAYEDFWTEHPSTFKSREKKNKSKNEGAGALHSFSWSQALLIADIQCRTYQFLVDFCLSILLKGREKEAKKKGSTAQAESSGVSSTKWTSEEYDSKKKELLAEIETYVPTGKSLTAPEARSDAQSEEADQDELPDLTEMRLRATYGPPDALNWDALEKLIESKVTDARIALLQLRKDPDIFEGSIRRERWNRDRNNPPDAIPDLAPKKGEFDASKASSWQEGMKFCVGNAIKNYDRWSDLQDAFMEFKRTYAERQAVLSTRGEDSEGFWPAAEELDTAIYGFYYRAHEFSEDLIEQDLKKMILGTPFYNKYLDLKSGVGIRSSLQQEGPPKRFNIFRKLLRLLTTDRKLFGLSALLDDLEREICLPSHEQQPAMQEDENSDEQVAKSSKKKKKKAKTKDKQRSMEIREQNQRILTSGVLKLLGDLAVFAECLSQVEHFQPWVTLYFADWNEDGSEKQVVRDSVQRVRKRFRELMSDRPWKTALKQGLPKPKRFEYPVDEERTRDNVEQLEQAEENLDDYWETLLVELGPELQDGLSDRTMALVQEKPVRPEWKVQEPEEPREKPATAQQKPPEDVEMRDAPELPETEAGPSHSKTPSPPKRPRDDTEDKQAATTESPKKKQRTDRRERAAKPKAAEQDVSDKILLPRKVFPDIYFLFFIPGEKRRWKTLEWRDFTNLMRSIGFNIKSAGGSLHKFEPGPELRKRLPQDKLGAIRCDNPHPETYLRFNQTRGIGDGLHARYKWTHETFVEQQ
ncbi:hypothetical protein GE09DRAFT_1267938 [Coniochaeta sp. 2T2.1]|nr:hypothetical protein GE09DRAFT_1267938 [Coniochaeta sp. 2T2.1]